MKQKTLVLFSGGLDSSLALALELDKGREVFALSIDYGQTNRAEIDRCRALSECWGFPLKVISLHMERTDCRADIPARNTVFLAKALEYAIINQCWAVVYGAEQDAATPDNNSPEYVKAMDTIMSLHGVRCFAPILELGDKKVELETAFDLGLPIDLIHSSRTNRVDGGCRASQRFLEAFYALFPRKNPIELLGRLALFHEDHTNPFNINGWKHLKDIFVDAGAPDDSERVGMWAVKQVLSRLARPSYMPTMPSGGTEEVVNALTELGYTKNPSRALPLVGV